MVPPSSSISFIEIATPNPSPFWFTLSKILRFPNSYPIDPDYSMPLPVSLIMRLSKL